MSKPIRPLALAAALALLAASPAGALGEREKCVYVLKGEGWPDRADRMDNDGLTAGVWCRVMWAGRGGGSCASRADYKVFLDAYMEISRDSDRSLERYIAAMKRYRAAERRHGMAPPGAPPPRRMWETERFDAKRTEGERALALYRACSRIHDRRRSH